MLVTERPGRLRVISKGVLDPKPVEGVPAVFAAGLTGLMEVALHPQFAANSLVYLTYTKQVSAGPPAVTTLALARGRWNGTALVDTKEIFNAGAGRERPGAPDVRPRRHALRHDRRRERPGRAEPEQPGGQGAAAEGRRHRARRQPVCRQGQSPRRGLHDRPPQLARARRAPGHGPGVAARERAQRRRRDQHPEAGGNYGWPIVSFGRTYPGPWQSDQFSRAGIEAPDRVLGAVHCRVGPGVLHRRPAAEVEGRRLRRAACAPARCRARDTWSASCSTRTWRSCGASRCSCRCASGSATCGRARMACSTW